MQMIVETLARKKDAPVPSVKHFAPICIRTLALLDKFSQQNPIGDERKLVTGTDKKLAAIQDVFLKNYGKVVSHIDFARSKCQHLHDEGFTPWHVSVFPPDYSAFWNF